MSDEMTYLLPNHNLGLDLMRATEAAALAAAPWAGRGQKESGDQAAVDAMRAVLNAVRMSGTIVIGEGEKDEAPMLANGEKVGTGEGPAVDIAVDPVDGTRLLAWGMRNSIAVLAAADAGSMYNPTMCFYMDKLVVGPEAADQIDLDAPIADNIAKVARAKGKSVGDTVVAVLNRPRHEQLVADIHAAGARTLMFTDGDVAASVAAASDELQDVDIMAGIGGSPEGVVSACAMKAMGGRILARLQPTSDEERQRTIDAGLDVDKVLDTNDLVSSDNTLFVATGITEGDLVNGVRHSDRGARTHSVVMRSTSGTIRYIEAYHHLDKVEAYAKAHGNQVGDRL
ncbi:class II fructose-bisphosphatase [Enemella evansiae]|uniref:Fructose-1,6-bisphosphatase n=1 Tax=Enemella evansiae TaxID=2016499 RepID=A0A255G3T9_9ACTN|nr:class II fructose-bisphosphatase [Enemella evansiae]PFG67153.1 fructose-1,6-bisphosphatase II [Propionibacteriaceae bacterium ES.041]OYN99279.1 fructose-bisphosphatase class II [Enemella evansiae]OYO05371.1 fructose-bisphosphatase class II [Enemella evansiae]OYO10588.1 fructose-bisphosphatase class II [Enemella evansiae]OYO15430.1 fructose-bisphosphatase class II [Enemella evansiae]